LVCYLLVGLFEINLSGSVLFKGIKIWDSELLIFTQFDQTFDAGASTSDQQTLVDSTGMIRSSIVHEARTKQIAYTLEDIEGTEW